MKRKSRRAFLGLPGREPEADDVSRRSFLVFVAAFIALLFFKPKHLALPRMEREVRSAARKVGVSIEQLDAWFKKAYGDQLATQQEAMFLPRKWASK